jgi:hypothetical protein
MNNKKYLAVSALDGRDELYLVTKSVEKKFHKLFGNFEGHWENHSEAVEWLRLNAKYVGVCTCVTP